LNGHITVHNLPYAPDVSRLIERSESVSEGARLRRAAWGTNNPLVTLYSGSLTHRKAVDVLISAFAQAAAKISEFRLLIVGDGDIRQRLQSHVAQLGLTDRVQFVGFLHGDDLRAAYLSADVFVLPTRSHEGWGVVVQEALAAGLPVVATDRVGSAADLIDETTGWIVPPDNPTAIADCFQKIATSPHILSAMREACRAKAIKFSAPSVAERMATILASFHAARTTASK
jgi:glycosyltransferase involved in cell wall biosynthesis